jgi:nitroreductase
MTATERGELIEFLRGQRQARAFTDEPVSEEDLQEILDVMRWTGSSKNSQPWQFVVVRDAAIRAEISKATQYTGWIANAPVVLVIVTEGDVPKAHAYDEGRLSERILLACQALGLGAGVVTFAPALAMDLVKSALQIPHGYSVYSAVALGHPAPDTRPNPNSGRKALSELVHWNRFGVK